jgi:AcrR family transcriptional regulator
MLRAEVVLRGMGGAVTRPDVGREWFDAAFVVLATDGPGGLTVPALCERRWVTKGSFYHHFASLPAFTAALVEDWVTRFAVVLADNAAQPDALRRLEHSTMHTMAIPHEAEAALRAAGRSDRVIGDAVARMDRGREQTLAGGIGGVIPDDRRAERVAAVGMSLLIGVQSAGAPVDRRLLLATGIEWLSGSVGLDVQVGPAGVALNRTA